MGGALAMVAALILSIWRVICESIIQSIILAGRLLLGGRKPENMSSAEEIRPLEGSDYAIYEGIVRHERRHPIVHRFQYKVRYALVNLDKVPSWFAAASRHHMTADQARDLVGTSGTVYLLCMPTSVGYEQNPLSIYYCYDDSESQNKSCIKTIAEVTNTPWGERVTFVFNAKDDKVAKPLHVSPFMDMKGSWRMHAPVPGDKLLLNIGVDHPDCGNLFVATLNAKRVDPGRSPEWFLWMMPQKVAVWIYWQALVLTWKGVAFVQHPKYIDGDLYKRRAEDLDATMTKNRSVKDGESSGRLASVSTTAMCPRLFKWREADGYPWL